MTEPLPVVTLPVELQMRALKAGIQLARTVFENDYKGRAGQSNESIEILARHLDGQLAEAAYCHFRGVEYVPRLNAFKNADVGEKTQVRATRHPQGRVILQPEDNDEHFYVLVRIKTQFEIAGWIKGKVGRIVAKAETHRPDGEALYVPNNYLNTSWGNERKAGHD